MLAFWPAVGLQSGFSSVSPKTSKTGDVNVTGKFSLKSSKLKFGASDHTEGSRFRPERADQPRKWAVVLVVSFAVFLLLGACGVIGGVLLVPVIVDVSSAAQKQQVIQQMEEIGQALNAYHAVHGRYPASYAKARSGQVGCSWRVLIASHLPGVDASSLPASSQTWDSPDNLKLGLSVPGVFVSPLVAVPPTTTETHVFAVMHQQSAISHPDSEKETAHTGNVSVGDTRKKILAVYLPNHTAHWAAPVDMTLKRLQDEVANITPENPVVFLFTDGSIVALEKPLDPFLVDDIVTGPSLSR